MYYEAETVITTHPDIAYNDGIRRIFLYADGKLPKGADEAEAELARYKAKYGDLQ